jgi:hypothetical protein
MVDLCIHRPDDRLARGQDCHSLLDEHDLRAGVRSHRQPLYPAAESFVIEILAIEF